MDKKPGYKRISFLIVGIILSACCGFAARVYAYLFEYGSSPHFFWYAAGAGIASWYLVRVLHHHVIGRYRFLPYAFWFMLWIIAVPRFNLGVPDDVKLLHSPSDVNPFSQTDQKRFSELRLELNGETRTSIGLLMNHKVSTMAHITPHSKLVFGIGLTKSKNPEERVSVKVLVESSDGKAVAADEVDLDRSRSRWVDHSVDLSAWTGQSVKIIIQTVGGLQSAFPRDNDSTMVYISNPRLIKVDPARPKPNVILIVMDTFREDHLAYNPTRPQLTPHLSELALQGTYFSRNYAQSSWTLPSTASLLTSRMPIQTGTVSGARLRLEMENLTLAEIIQQHGWRTVGISANLLVRPDNYFDQGFDSFFLVNSPLRYCLDIGDRVNKVTLDWLDNKVNDPFFMLLFYIDPHSPYFPPYSYRNLPPAPETSFWDLAKSSLTTIPNINKIPSISMRPDYADNYRAFYQGEVQYLDACVGELIDKLKQKGVFDRTLIIVTSDHGEEFLEHGLFIHGTSLYEELIRVPLIIVDGAKPGRGRTINQLTRNLDVFPTILEYLEIDAPEQTLGTSLWPRIHGEAQDKNPGVYALAELPKVVRYHRIKGMSRKNLKDVYQRAIIGDRFKVIEKTNLVSNKVEIEWFDLEADPMEQRGATGDYPPNIREMYKQMESFFEGLPDKMDIHRSVKISPEMKRLLKSLGYVK